MAASNRTVLASNDGNRYCYRIDRAGFVHCRLYRLRRLGTDFGRLSRGKARRRRAVRQAIVYRRCSARSRDRRVDPCCDDCLATLAGALFLSADCLRCGSARLACCCGSACLACCCGSGRRACGAGLARLAGRDGSARRACGAGSTRLA